METHDWSVLDNPKVVETIEAAARAAGTTAYMGYDDLVQLGAIRVAEIKANLHLPARRGEFALLRLRLDQDFTDMLKTEWRRGNRMDPMVEEGVEDGLYFEPQLDLDKSGGYSQEVIETVIPALWDDSYAMRLDSNPLAPDSDMPKGSGGRISGPAHWDLIADVRRAWQQSGLTDMERKAVLLTIGVGMSLRDAADYLDCSYVSVRNYTAAAMCKLVSFLNGPEVADVHV